MTRSANARLAGFAYLFYITVAFPSLFLVQRATAGQGLAAKLTSIAQHAADLRIAAVLSLLGCFSALVLAVTLFALTRDEDPDIAMLGLTCRVAEGITGAVTIPATLALVWLATSGAAASETGAQALAGFVLDQGFAIGATFFAVGSTLFSWLLLRGRTIPLPLAWLGVVWSALLVLALPLQMGGVLHGPITQLMWIPMAVFEICLGFWWLITGGIRAEAQ